MGLLRRLFGAKKTSNSSPPSSSTTGKDKKRWSFAKSSFSSSTTTPSRLSKHDANFETSLDPNKHAIAVAAATAAVAEAALAAAHAAAEVVRLTSAGVRGGQTQHRIVEEFAVAIAVVKIQSAFRGYLVSNFVEHFTCINF